MSRIRYLALALATLGLSSHAAASTTFPEALRKKLELEQLPNPPLGCKLCHQDDKGGLMTATKPFGRALMQQGATATNVPSLIAALDRLDEGFADSDADGVSDLDELRMEQDPNVAMAVDGKPVRPVEQIPLPETGCEIGVTAQPSGSVAVLAAGLVVLARRRRRQRR